jgi:hypothetical protein
MRSKALRLWFGEGKKGSLVPVFYNYEKQYSPIIALLTDGSVEIQFQYMKSPFYDTQKRIELLNRFNQIDGLSIHESRVTGRPNFPINLLLNNSNIQKFYEACEWYINGIHHLS